MDQIQQDQVNQSRFYNICKQTLESAKRGQYNADNGFPNGFTSQDLRHNLSDQAKAIDINWGPDSGTPFTMLSPGIDAMNGMIDKAAMCYQNWLDAGKPEGK